MEIELDSDTLEKLKAVDSVSLYKQHNAHFYLIFILKLCHLWIEQVQSLESRKQTEITLKVSTL